jgi:hypothetical protein
MLGSRDPRDSTPYSTLRTCGSIILSTAGSVLMSVDSLTYWEGLFTEYHDEGIAPRKVWKISLFPLV